MLLLWLLPLLLLRAVSSNLAAETAKEISEAATTAPPTTTVKLVDYVLQITSANINSTLQKHDVVLLNFYADWCPYSRQLAPIFASAAAQLSTEWPEEPRKQLLGRVDCVKERGLADFYQIRKFPTLRLFYHGSPQRREYRGQRSSEAIIRYVRAQFKPAIMELQQSQQGQDVVEIDPQRRVIIGYFEQRQQLGFEVYEQLAERHKHDCDFYVSVGAESAQQKFHHLPAVIFRPAVARSHGNEDQYVGSVLDQDSLESWLLEKCVPLVREVDFDNVEELIEQGLPLLMLFHHPSDISSVKDFKAIVEMQLSDFRGRFNFITVDGIKFEHSVQHMGKSRRDLPLIAIDSLRFMYPFPRYLDIFVPGKLKQYMELFISQQKLKLKLKLEREKEGEKAEQETESTFKKLGPSKHRYSLLQHDEL